MEIKGRVLRYTTDELDDRSTYDACFDDTSFYMPSATRVWALEIFPPEDWKPTHLLLVETGDAGVFRRIGCFGVWYLYPESLKAKWYRDAKWATVKII